LGARPVRLLAKLPIPVPLVVCEPVMTGLAVVPQHTPRAVTAALPSLVIEPPLVTELMVIFVTAVVVKVGITGSFLQLLIKTLPNIRHTKTKGAINLFILTSN
jgi:hypothetical protein